jgi:hypothetical protein
MEKHRTPPTWCSIVVVYYYFLPRRSAMAESAESGGRYLVPAEMQFTATGPVAQRNTGQGASQP